VFEILSVPKLVPLLVIVAPPINEPVELESVPFTIEYDAELVISVVL
jgi:hypothetical protein